MTRAIIIRAYMLTMLVATWCYSVSLAPLPPPMYHTIALPLVGMSASQSLTATVARPTRPFIAWPLRAHAQQACTRERAMVVLREEVNVGVIPVGRAEAWSCTSIDEAQAVLNGEITQIKVQAWCWYAIGEAPAQNLACPLRPPEVLAAQTHHS